MCQGKDKLILGKRTQIILLTLHYYSDQALSIFKAAIFLAVMFSGGQDNGLLQHPFNLRVLPEAET